MASKEQNRNRFINTENSPVVTTGEDGGDMSEIGKGKKIIKGI